MPHLSHILIIETTFIFSPIHMLVCIFCKKKIRSYFFFVRHVLLCRISLLIFTHFFYFHSIWFDYNDDLFVCWISIIEFSTYHLKYKSITNQNERVSFVFLFVLLIFQMLSYFVFSFCFFFSLSFGFYWQLLDMINRATCVCLHRQHVWKNYRNP